MGKTSVNITSTNNNTNEADKSKKYNERFMTMLLSSLIASLASLNFGFCLGYTSPTQVEMLKDTKLNINENQFSWFSALVGVGAMIGAGSGGIILDKIGRKWSVILCAAIYIPGWLLISFAKNVAMLYIGRLIIGVGCGLSSLAAPVYISEISSPRYRGGLATIPQLCITIGILVSFSLGIAFKWNWLALFGIGLSAVMAILMLFMPETPRFLLATQKRTEALEQLKWLRGPNYNVEEECRSIENNLGQQERAKFSDLKSPACYKPLLIGILLMVFQQFSGVNAILFFAAKILSTAGFTNATTVSLAVAGSQVIATAISTLIADKFGRRKMLMFGSAVMSITLILLGMYYDVTDLGPDNSFCIFRKVCHKVELKNISWLAVTCTVVFIVTFSFGWGPLPWVLMAEIFPAKIRGKASGFVSLCNWVGVFIIAVSFQKMTEVLHEQGTFWLFGAFTIVSFFFTYSFVPETKGKTLEDIELIFM